MDLRSFKVKLETGEFDVDAEDVFVNGSFVCFVNNLDSEEEETITVAVFNASRFISAMEVKK